MLAIDPGATSVSGPYTGELAATFTDLSDHMLGLAFDFSAETLEYQRWGRETTDSITINKRRLMRIVFIIESGDIASGDDKLMTLWDEAYESDDASFAFIYQHNRKALARCRQRRHSRLVRFTNQPTTLRDCEDHKISTDDSGRHPHITKHNDTFPDIPRGKRTAPNHRRTSSI